MLKYCEQVTGRLLQDHMKIIFCFGKKKKCSPENDLFLMWFFPIQLKNSAFFQYEVIQVINFHSQKWERSRSLYSRAIITEPLCIPPG